MKEYNIYYFLEQAESSAIYYDENKYISYNLIIGSPEVIFSDNLGDVKNPFYLPITIKNDNKDPVRVQLRNILVKKVNVLKSTISLIVLPHEIRVLEALISLLDDFPPGNYILEFELSFFGNITPSPKNGMVKLNLVVSSPTYFDSAQGIVTVIIISVLLFSIIAYYLVRKYLTNYSFDKTTISRQESLTTFKRAELYNDKNRGKYNTIVNQGIENKQKTSPHAIEMVIQKNNIKTALKTVQWFEIGEQHSIGNSECDYPIFDDSNVGIIAIIQRNKESYTVVPQKIEYFKEHFKEMQSCLKRSITVTVPDTKQEYLICFNEWISPLEEINRIMHLIDKPGIADFDY